MSTPADPDFTLNHLLVEVIQVGFGSDLDRQPGQIQKMKIVEREFSNTMKKGKKKEKKRKSRALPKFLPTNFSMQRKPPFKDANNVSLNPIKLAFLNLRFDA